jgi:hypothetical protein
MRLGTELVSVHRLLPLEKGHPIADHVAGCLPWTMTDFVRRARSTRNDNALTPLLLRNAGGLANGVPPLVFIRHEFPELFCRRAPDHHADRH